jgi:IPT/TIG domain
MLAVGPIAQGAVPFSIQVYQVWGLTITVEVLCQVQDQVYQQWQSDTYDLIVGAYKALLQAYNSEKAGLSDEQTNLVDANSPDQNAETITQELKRQVIEMLVGKPFRGLGAINWDLNGINPPTTILSTAANIAPEVQFLEQAFEWETLSYICYPYYWADISRWPDLAVITGNDSNFADFLRAGSARVVLAARPGFEDQVNFYVQFGILWGGGPMPAPGDPDYLSVADEIKAMQQGPLDVTVIDTWQVTLPTTLIWLQNPACLPKNTNPTINTTPRIIGLSPASGAIGNLVMIGGSNFGDLEGNSTVSFSGTEAAPTAWSSTSVAASVPAEATTGAVVVTVNGVASNDVPFAVVPAPPENQAEARAQRAPALALPAKP